MPEKAIFGHNMPDKVRKGLIRQDRKEQEKAIKSNLGHFLQELDK